MKKKIIMSVLTLALIVGMGMNVNAAGTPVVNFTSGGALQYTNADTFGEVFQTMVPGVEESLAITLTNSNPNTASFYMAAKDIEALTMQGDGEMQTGAYSVVVTAGTNEIYNSTVGGFSGSEGEGYAGSQGLEELSELEGMVFLATLPSGQSTNLTFDLMLDGLSNGDEYQSSRGNITFDFAVAYNDVPGSTTENNVVTTKGAVKKNIVTTIEDIFVPLASGITAVKTGDPAALGLLIGVGCIGAAGLFLTRKRKSVEDAK